MRHILLLSVTAVVLSISGPGVGHAVVATNITSDGTMGTTISQAGNIYNINGGTIRGSNLFQSFGLFNVGTGDIASFNGPGGIANILGRVTGGQQSLIDGMLRSTIPGANLYLLNPAGVLFGANATLDVSGSFHVSTADYVKFANGDKFFVNPSNPATVLSMDPIAAFGFLGPTPAGISVQESVLQVPNGSTLSLVGGNLDIVGGINGLLRAFSGRINLASVASPGEVRLVNATGGPDLNVDSFSALGEIRLRQFALLDARGAPGGTVVIRGGRLTVEDSFILADTLGATDGAPVGVDISVTGTLTVNQNSQITSNSGFDGGPNVLGRAGDVQITAGRLEMSGGSIASQTFGDGRAGDMSVNVDSLTLAGGGQIGSSTFGAGAAGNVTVNAMGTVNIAGPDIAGNLSGIFSDAQGTGNAGFVDLSAKSLTITGGGTINTNTLGAGDAGSVTVAVDGPLALSGASPDGFGSSISSDTAGSGDAGPVSVSASTLTLTGGGTISSSTSLGSSGQGGSVTVTARDSLVLSGQSPGGFFSIIASETGGSGDAGQVSVSARTLTLTAGGTISSATFGAGRGGNIIVSASDSVSISDQASGIFSTSEVGATGRGGDIQIETGNVTLNNSATISAKSAGAGDAGNITITAGDSFVMNNSFVTTEATQSNGGDITLHVAGRLVHLINSEITAHAAGNGGNILIDPQFIIVDASKIIASAGINGGNITLVATNGIFISFDSIIDASGTLGISGSINISAPTTSLSGTLAPLPQEFLQVAGLLSARCAARLSGKSSSFVLTGRDGLPPEPGGFWPSPLYSTGPTGTLSARNGRGEHGSPWLGTEYQLQTVHGPVPASGNGCAL